MYIIISYYIYISYIYIYYNIIFIYIYIYYRIKYQKFLVFLCLSGEPHHNRHITDHLSLLDKKSAAAGSSCCEPLSACAQGFWEFSAVACVDVVESLFFFSFQRLLFLLTHCLIHSLREMLTM